MPKWAWVVAIGGLVLLVVAGFLDPGYTQNLISGLGIVSLLLVPIFVAERSILAAIESKNAEAVARAELSIAMRVEQTFQALGERLSKPRPLPSTSLKEGRGMLKADGWVKKTDAGRSEVWVKSRNSVAIPIDVEEFS